MGLFVFRFRKKQEHRDGVIPKFMEPKTKAYSLALQLLKVIDESDEPNLIKLASQAEQLARQIGLCWAD